MTGTFGQEHGESFKKMITIVIVSKDSPPAYPPVPDVMPNTTSVQMSSTMAWIIQCHINTIYGKVMHYLRMPLS
jgi:hypothetical protein